MMKKIISLLLVSLLLAALLVLPASAAADDYVVDLADILTDEEESKLATACRSIAQTYNCGVYIGTAADMREYGYSDIEEFAEAFFDDLELGLGDGADGILLVLSMAERDYDLDSHGRYGNYAFTSHGKETLEAVFLDDFRNNDWFSGFRDYVVRCSEMLELAGNGEPVDIPASTRLAASVGLSLILSLIIAFLICMVLKGKNKSVRTAADADAYVAAGAVDIRIRDDQFIHQTVTRVKIEKNHSSGGGGGHSHSSGKF